MKRLTAYFILGYEREFINRLKEENFTVQNDYVHSGKMTQSLGEIVYGKYLIIFPERKEMTGYEIFEISRLIKITDEFKIER